MQPPVKRKKGLVLLVGADKAQFLSDPKVAAGLLREGGRNQDFSAVREADQTSVKCFIQVWNEEQAVELVETFGSG